MTTPHKTAYEEMHELNQQITYHADLYFNKDIQEIQNHVYDEMVERFEELAEHNPEVAQLFETARKPVPIHEVTNEGLKSIRFDTAMLSLKKALTKDAVTAWIATLPKEATEHLVREGKVDGLALQLDYVKGRLVSMATRGDGMEGEEVIHALPLFEYIPQTLVSETGELREDLTLSIRGEAYVGLEDFHRYNELASKVKSTPRNAVSGWVRALPENQDHNITGRLRFAAYWCSDTLGFEKYTGLRGWLIQEGFGIAPLVDQVSFDNDASVNADVPMDGVVFKVNLFSLHQSLGANSRHPRWAIAYKYPDVEAVTRLLTVVWSTAATGRVIPVAHYDWVRIGGVVCTKANLDNYKQFIALELRAGALIGITRNGDVIPRVNRVVENGKGSPLKAPEECPSCSGVLEVRVGKQSADLVCTNTTDCPGQLIGRCINLVHKRTLDIDGLGPVMLAALVENERIQYPYDVLNLKRLDVGEKIYNRIQQLKKNQIPYWRFIKALGLPNVDVTRAKKLASYHPPTRLVAGGAEVYRLFDWLQDVDALIKIPGISAGIAIPIATSFESQDFVTNAVGLENLLKTIQTAEEEHELKVCITGTVGQTREEMIDYFGDHGIELVDKLTKDCNCLLIGERPGQSKVLKATELGIPRLNATEATSIDALINIIKTGVVK